ncbi:MAG: phosphoadenosine phosphosulfate reductase family protein [Thermosphaera sp.]
MEYLSWSKTPSVPVLSRKGGWRITRDVWLAGAWERRLVAALVEKYFDFKLDLERELLIFHRAPSWSSHVDYAFEFHASALRLGVAYYDLREGWVLSPTGALGSLLESLGAPACELEPSRHVKGKYVALPPDCPLKARMVLVRMGRHVGVGRRVDGGLGRVKIKDVAPRGFRMLPPGRIEDLVELNREVVEDKAGEAKGFIKRVYGSVQKSRKIPVSFSGGADSTAVLSLAVEALGAEKVLAVYSDTGLEFPESLKYAEEVASKLGVELVVLKPSVDVLSLVGEKGLMSVEDRWCTRILKLEPLKKFYRGSGVAVYLDGARDYESFNRARTPRIGYNPLIPGVKRALPIKDWTRLLVQIYLYSRGVRLNPLYDQGFTRIGCVACPAMHLYELHLSYSRHKMVHEELIKASGVERSSYLRLEWGR